MRLLPAFVRRALLPLALADAARAEAYGVKLADLHPAADTAETFERIRAALAVLHEAQPWRLGGIRRGFRYVLVIPAGGPFYNLDTRCCVLDRKAVAANPPARLAALLIHEAVHARLHRRGIPQDGLHVDRVEAVAIRAELAFLETQPDMEPYVRALRDAAAKKWWRPEAMRARRREQLVALGMPEWFVKAHARFFP